MMRPSKIVLATDLRARSDRAFARAAELAREWKARLSVVHAIDPDFPGSPSAERAKDAISIALERVRKDLRRFDATDAQITIAREKPAPLVLEVVNTVGADIIVAGLGATANGERGGTVEAIARASRVPLLVVKAKGDDHAPIAHALRPDAIAQLVAIVCRERVQQLIQSGGVARTQHWMEQPVFLRDVQQEHAAE